MFCPEGHVYFSIMFRTLCCECGQNCFYNVICWECAYRLQRGVGNTSVSNLADAVTLHIEHEHHMCLVCSVYHVKYFTLRIKS